MSDHPAPLQFSLRDDDWLELMADLKSDFERECWRFYAEATEQFINAGLASPRREHFERALSNIDFFAERVRRREDEEQNDDGKV